MKVTKIYCDIHKCVNEVDRKGEKPETYQVVWVTEQTEGRPIEPRLGLVRIDVCKECVSKIIKGAYIKAAGAQGHNQYRLIDTKK